MLCAEKGWNLDMNPVKEHRSEKEKKALTKILVGMEGNYHADELAKEGADVDCRQMAAARAFNHHTSKERHLCFH